MAQESIAAIFLEQWNSENQGKNSSAMSFDEYTQSISYLQTAEESSTSLTQKQYYLMRHFCLVPGVNRDKKLVRKRLNEGDNLLYVIPNELMYETILKEHIALGHPGMTNMAKHMKKRFYNVTQKAIRIFVSLCEECQKKRSAGPKKDIVVNQIRSNEMFERMQVDLIDMQVEPDGEFRYILNAQDHMSKYIHLRPIKQKTGEQIAAALMEIFMTSAGAPKILQFDHGTEFKNETVHELKNQWNGLCIIHGRPMHPQSQDSVERANAEVSNRLRLWQSDNGFSASNWVSGLKHVQFQINSTHNSGINTTPIEALYGKTAAVGLATSSLPPAKLEVGDIDNEDQLDEMQDGQFLIFSHSDTSPSHIPQPSSAAPMILPSPEVVSSHTEHITQSVAASHPEPPSPVQRSRRKGETKKIMKTRTISQKRTLYYDILCIDRKDKKCKDFCCDCSIKYNKTKSTNSYDSKKRKITSNCGLTCGSSGNSITSSGVIDDDTINPDTKTTTYSHGNDRDELMKVKIEELPIKVEHFNMESTREMYHQEHHTFYTSDTNGKDFDELMEVKIEEHRF